jgi:hypothetical protein
MIARLQDLDRGSGSAARASDQPKGQPLTLEEIATLWQAGPFQKTTNPLACDLPYPTENQVF